ncbi:MAG TPA: 4-vinyl reductase [Anaerolineae bacterium]
MEDRPMPNANLRLLLVALQEVMGENGLKAVLKQGGLERYIDNFPPDDTNRNAKFSEYGQVQQAVESFYGGPRGARAMMRRAGHATFQHTLKSRPAILGLVGVAIKVLPEGTRMKFILDRIAKASTDEVNLPAHVEEHEDHFLFVANACTCVFRSRDPKLGPCCFVTAGVLEAAVEWATGKHHTVKEVSCLQNGDDACRYRIERASD